MSDAPVLRVSDAEREAVVDRLRDAAGEGRLDADELAERVTAADAARTRAELDAVVADLPAPAAPPGPRVDRGELRRRLAAFLPPNVICVAIYLATDPGGYFWPIWVMLGTGIGLVFWLVNSVLGVDDDKRERERRPRLPEPPQPLDDRRPRR